MEQVPYPAPPMELLRSLQSRLEADHEKLVLVESCTAGLVAAWLGMLPGISNSWCGSWVIYRNASKSDWLGIDPQLLADPSIGPVSHRVTRELAEAALARTPEATLVAAITGHLGPQAPVGLDGVIYCCVGDRTQLGVRQHRLECLSPASSADLVGRIGRQAEAARRLLEDLTAKIA